MRYEKISPSPKTAPPHVETNLSEEALLRHHAESAVGAMRELLTKIHGDLSQVADPREWAERYPWATVAAAAAAGFVAAKVITPRKDESAPLKQHAAAAPGIGPTVAGAAELDRAQYEAYLRDTARAGAAASPPPHESMWTPLVEMAKTAAARYIMSAAQAGIAAFAAAHAAKAATEDDDRDRRADSSAGVAADGRESNSDLPPP